MKKIGLAMLASATLAMTSCRKSVDASLVEVLRFDVDNTGKTTLVVKTPAFPDMNVFYQKDGQSRQWIAHTLAAQNGDVLTYEATVPTNWLPACTSHPWKYAMDDVTVLADISVWDDPAARPEYRGLACSEIGQTNNGNNNTNNGNNNTNNGNNNTNNGNNILNWLANSAFERAKVYTGFLPEAPANLASVSKTFLVGKSSHPITSASISYKNTSWVTVTLTPSFYTSPDGQTHYAYAEVTEANNRPICANNVQGPIRTLQMTDPTIKFTYSFSNGTWSSVQHPSTVGCPNSF